MARWRAFLARSDIERATSFTDSLATTSSLLGGAGAGGPSPSVFLCFGFFNFLGGAEGVSSVAAEGPFFSIGSSIFRFFLGGDTTLGISLDLFFFELAFFEGFPESDVGLVVFTSVFSESDPEGPAATSFFFSASFVRLAFAFLRRSFSFSACAF